ncbi:CLUMA_CG012071, isoform A [Clunio marinus]|uniref:CLUMA_CG012071, isoform A n=1 Tax=Clunio marinus TaxID=568069 RepID=A0A1J1IEE4_9DIPT|nr:CLUMA_CG012071, isoform A [Clunio marinus]
MKIIFVWAALIFVSLEGVRAGEPEPAGPCVQPIDEGDEPCDNTATFKWFYVKAINDCVRLVYSGCGGNENRFPSQTVCSMRCVQR